MDAGPRSPIILLNSVCRYYKVGDITITALHDVSLSIHSGEFISICGPSGGGKSTLLQILGGVDRPDKGDLIINNVSLNKLNDAELSRLRNREIGFIFQSFYLQPFLTVRENVLVPAMFAGEDKKKRQTYADELLEYMGLSERAAHLPSALSGGQIQRTAIARALINKPNIILADEPTGNLDSRNGKNVIDLLKAIRQKYGTTIVIVTHDQLIARQADRSYTLIDGRLI